MCEHFERIVSAMRHHDSVGALGRDGLGDERFTTRAMLSSEQRLVCDAARLAASTAHRVSRGDMGAALAVEAARGIRLSAEQRGAFDHVLRPTGLALVTGYAGTGKRSEEHTSELQSLMRSSYAVFCLKKKTNHT